ncbi:helicase SRCAP-like [Zingiber officinale]|uniref:helicase SRCAP-like n=1 Tax=Zingiber officinale TaxID=94328 RepID=UPI001C4AB471|nr:helicase SRCAP-like [Zingiber officinale]
MLMLEGILHAFGLSPASTEIRAPFVAALLRSFASQETPSVVVLQALNEELTQGLSSDPAVSAGPQPSGHQTSETVAASALIEPPAPSPADSVIPRRSDQPAPEPSPAGQVPPLPPTMKLRLTRKGKRTAPVTATSPPPPRRQRVVSISSPTRSSDTSSTQETSLAREKASDLEVADPPLDLTAPVPIQSVLPAPPSSSGDQPPDSLAPSASPLLGPPSSALPTLNLASADLAFEASWRLPSETDPAYVPAADLSLIFAPPEPSLGSLDAYLRAAGESAASARAISHAAFDKLQQLEAALKTSESSLASEADRHQATVSELKAKEAELLSQSADLSSLQQSQELLQTGLADAQALASAAASREATMRTQWEACQATLQSLRAELSKAQEAVSQGQGDLSVARAEVAENKNSLEAYRAGELERLKAYRPLDGLVALSWGHWELPQETFHSFEADDGLFLLEAPHPAADPAPEDISAQAPPVAASEASADPASSNIVPADPGLRPLASRDPVPSSSDVV